MFGALCAKAEFYFLENMAQKALWTQNCHIASAERLRRYFLVLSIRSFREKHIRSPERAARPLSKQPSQARC